MTYNIRHGLGMDSILDLERIVRVIRSVDPDILILNEVDQGTNRSGGVAQADSLAKMLDMQAYFGRSIDYDGGQYGNALLSKFPVNTFRVIDISTDTLREGRSVFLASLRVDTDTLYVIGTHLGLDSLERQQQVTSILQVLPVSERVILAGDFNFEPGTQGYKQVNNRLKDGIAISHDRPSSTFPANQPQRRIDYIFLGMDILPGEGPQIKSADLEVASDHLPQILTFHLK